MMNGSLSIRLAEESDIGGMSLLLSQLFSIESDFVPDDERQRRGLRLLLASQGASILVAEERGRVIGMASMQILISTAQGGRVGQVEDVVVEQGRRGKGIGAALLKRMQGLAQEQGLSRLQLAADRDNGGALGFYAREGWNQTSLVVLRYNG